ncbi:MAG: potassium channel family protein [bacterium]
MTEAQHTQDTNPAAPFQEVKGSMTIVVVGCGRVGSDLALRLHQKGHQVTVVDQRAAAFQNLDPAFGGRTVEGEVLAQEVLKRAGIEHADGLAAVTNSDSVNAVIAHVARTVFHVPQVVARSYDPRRRPIHEAFGVEVVSSTSWGAQRIEEMLTTASIRAVASAGSGEVEICEFVVPKAWRGRRIRELIPEEHCRAVAITRAGRAVLSDPQTAIEPGDIIHVAATLEGLQELRSRLASQMEGA